MQSDANCLLLSTYGRHTTIHPPNSTPIYRTLRFNAIAIALVKIDSRMMRYAVFKIYAVRFRTAIINN